MVLKKCPSCKNIVSMDSYCCPRCGIGFRALRIRRLLKWTCLIALVAWVIHRYFIP